MKKCLFNTESSNVAAFCALHRKHLTVKQIKCKNCLQKQCWHLQKNEKHMWWTQREKKKAMKKARKQLYV